jgi:hypothetical protein
MKKEGPEKSNMHIKQFSPEINTDTEIASSDEIRQK